MSWMAFSSGSRVTPYVRRSRPASSGSSTMASRTCSVATYSSSISFAMVNALFQMRDKPLVIESP